MSTQQQEIRPPLPPFTLETAIEKARLAEDGWNSRDAAKVALAYSLDTKWRNRAEFANNRAECKQDADQSVRYPPGDTSGFQK